MLVLLMACPGSPDTIDTPIDDDPVIEDPVIENPVDDPVVDDTPEDEYIVTEEVYNQTFDEVEALVQELNEIIRSGNFNSWKNYLVPEYKAVLESRENLQKSSESPILKKYNIELRNLKDYFEYVVKPSRSSVRLDELVFIDDTRVKAIMIVKEKQILIYQLENLNGTWKLNDFSQ